MYYILNKYVLSLYVTNTMTSKYFQRYIIILLSEIFKTLFYQINYPSMSSFKLDQQFFTLGLKVSKIRCNHTDEKYSNKTKKYKFVHTSIYFKPIDMEGDRNCIYHALTIGMNELNLEGFNDKRNHEVLIEVICEY